LGIPTKGGGNCKKLFKGSENTLGHAHAGVLGSSNGVVLLLHELLVSCLQLANLVLKSRLSVRDGLFTFLDNLIEFLSSQVSVLVNFR
jgi:hypothetical protein